LTTFNNKIVLNGSAPATATSTGEVGQIAVDADYIYVCTALIRGNAWLSPLGKMDIRKISIGANYKDAMHYLVGQEVVGGGYVIHLIKNHEELESYKIWITNGTEIVLWKEFKKMPISIEYNINF
jgi:hypothetical protein